ncbi:MATE family efflux transporter [Shewanella sedimentimangrovi]|uniref:MATE family efflux transporter n=1 Tax=Shewanella sedimentimangrovi TaxID=2814293 RepID=A0ABX7R1K6_9GAMM|nr:MATE family efflux transporter [Shewanella sedimentimangrovi]QSX36740.1 MATE family efflux transporter [Shewanella sedimentimangrovi]
MRDKHGLLHAPIATVLLKMTLPNLVGILTILGFSLVDTFFVSQLGTEALAAISFTFPVTLVVSSIAVGIGAGVSTLLGRLIGGGHSGEAKVFLHDTLLLTFALVSLICALGSLFTGPLFSLLGARGESLSLIHDYMFVWFLGAPLLVMVMVGNQGLRSTGDTHSPAKIMALAAVINLILDPLLIFGIGPFPRLEIQGAAIASLLSWLLAAFLSGYLLIVKRNMIAFADADWPRLKANWRRLARIAQPAALMNLMNPIANAVIMAMLARVDHGAVAAFGAGTRIESVLLMVVMALSSSLMPFIAQNLGAGQPARAREALMLALKFVLLFQTLLYLPLLLLADPIAALFSSDPQVVEWLSFYLIALPAAYGPLGVVIIVATSLNAYHRSMASLVINVCRLFLLMLPLAALGSYLYGVQGLMLALPLTNALMGLACFILAGKVSEPGAAVSAGQLRGSAQD